MNQPIDIQLVHPKLVKSHPVSGNRTQALGCITLREWRPGKEWVTNFHNPQTGGYYYAKFFQNLPDAEADFRQRVLEVGGKL